MLAVPLLIGAAAALLEGSPHAHADETPPNSFEHGNELAPLPRKDVPPVTDPAQIYLRDCATCHGAGGHGTPRGPTLVGQGSAGVFYWVSTGRMPLQNTADRIGRKPAAYPPDVVNALVDYVAALAGGGGPEIPKVGPGNVAHGLDLFALNCATCHAWSGSGSIIFDGKVPTVAPATPEQIAAAIRIGPGEMPAFGQAALNEQQLNDVVAYANSLKDKRDEGGYGLFHRGPTTEGAAALVLGLGSALLAIGWIGAKARSREVA